MGYPRWNRAGRNGRGSCCDGRSDASTFIELANASTILASITRSACSSVRSAGIAATVGRMSPSAFPPPHPTVPRLRVEDHGFNSHDLRLSAAEWRQHPSNESSDHSARSATASACQIRGVSVISAAVGCDAARRFSMTSASHRRARKLAV